MKGALLSFVFVAGCCPAAVPDAQLADVMMLVGAWHADGTYETWLPPSDGVMRGDNRTFVDGEVVHEEYLFIEHVAGEIQYNAFPKGQKHNIFALSEAEPGRLVFEDPEHDFPKRIIYQRDGDELVATAEGDDKSSQWRLSPARCN